ncbi:MAG: NRDE family protein [Betaproteobacteria bacterium]|nr:NRDE family protein [Betaproteobacteria bacterium]
MCLIIFAHKVHPDYPLVLAANRDEVYTRPTAPAAFWEDHPDIYGGRDLDHGGTWLGVSRNGRIAAVTNFRDGYATRNAARSRGELVSSFLSGNQPAADYVNRVARDTHAYNGFNLIAGDLDELYYVSNRGSHVAAIAPGIHGVSNHLLNTPWPKVEQGKKNLAELLQHGAQELIDGLFAVLADRTIAPDHALPDTGVGLPRERVLSPAFIISPTYGTRSSTVILVDNHGQVIFIERSFGERGKPEKSVTARFALETVPTPASV